jgi:hypothetical protein
MQDIAHDIVVSDGNHDGVSRSEDVIEDLVDLPAEDPQLFPSCGSQMRKHKCKDNDIKRKQDLLLHFFHDNVNAKFNRIGGHEVNVNNALKCLYHIVENNLTENEADGFLNLINGIVSSVSTSTFALPMSSKFSFSCNTT